MAAIKILFCLERVLFTVTFTTTVVGVAQQSEAPN